MAHLPVHPAPGLGDLLPGFFVVPQNPIQGVPTPVVASINAKAGGAPVKIPTMGELLPGFFVVPENPLRNALGMSGLGCGSCGLGQTTPNLMGSLANVGTSMTNWLQESVFAGIPNWLLLGGAVAVYFMATPGGKEYRAQREEYRAQRSAARGYRRLAKALA